MQNHLTFIYMESIVIKESASEVLKNSNYTAIATEVKKSKAKSGIIKGINFLVKHNVLYLF